MLESSLFLNYCKENNFTLFSGTPCSYLKPFINFVINSDEFSFIEVTNEGDAVAFASGAYLGGRKSVVMFQNSGLGNAVNPLTSLSNVMRIPFLGIVTLRGEPGGEPDEPQHELMGRITKELLELMEIPWLEFPANESELKETFIKVDQHFREHRTPLFLVMKKDSVQKYELPEQAIDLTKRNHSVVRSEKKASCPGRTAAIEAIREVNSMNSAVIATTGKTGRELFELGDESHNLYMVGSMGCALPIGIGLTYSQYKGKVIVIDGDGAALMRLGNMAFAGQLKRSNIVHILLDNGTHDSTGGQKTFSEKIDFPGIASSCGYERIYETNNLDEFKKALSDSLNQDKLSFVYLRISPGSPQKLGRPTITPANACIRFSNYIIGNKDDIPRNKENHKTEYPT
jgi:phosphonopyruvate decarboxylase